MIVAWKVVNGGMGGLLRFDPGLNPANLEIRKLYIVYDGLIIILCERLLTIK